MTTVLDKRNIQMFLLFLHGNLCYGYGECPTILYNKVSDKWHMQTMQTQIRLLLKEQSDKGLLFATPLSILRNN